jgi:hypothetical protein
LIDTDMVQLDQPIPSDYNHIHLGGGQTEVVLTLPQGTHTLQLLLGDHQHVAHQPSSHVEEDHDLCALAGQRYPQTALDQAAGPSGSARCWACAWRPLRC